ncbi:unnamed protein product [Urochloa humidicola]
MGWQSGRAQPSTAGAPFSPCGVWPELLQVLAPASQSGSSTSANGAPSFEIRLPTSLAGACGKGNGDRLWSRLVKDASGP